ncbi:hypothetical protein CK203_068645 [Vitis vinifera]|uniref:Retrovirus-related Pol polyprotein from transposon RE2 n=1 Tax=Vitis vinifera TaxID=29760 RepID=A0A438EEU3_VITVI|nr:hypothetical protein CK203_068645 [Vitis vinifera]
MHKVRWPDEPRVSLTSRSKLREQLSRTNAWKRVRLLFLHRFDFPTFPISFRPFSGGTRAFDQLLRGTYPWQTNNVLVAKGGSNDTGKKSNNRGGSKTSDSYNNDSSNIVCYYYHELGHAKKYCKKLQNRNKRNQIANVATTSSTFSSSSDKTVMVSVDEFAKFSQYQESLKKSTLVTALAETGKTCLISPSNKWDLMTKQIIGKGHVSDGLYILDAWVPRSVACSNIAFSVEAH